MGAFKYVPTHETEARQRAKTPSRESRVSQQRNVEAVLSIGATRYFTFHQYLLSIPPVPFKLGQRVLALYVRSMTDAKQVAKTGDKKATDSYYATVSVLVDLMWTHVQPIGKFRRVLKRCGLLRNVLRSASEQEVTDVCNFFLQGRMMSTVQVMEIDRA